MFISAALQAAALLVLQGLLSSEHLAIASPAMYAATSLLRNFLSEHQFSYSVSKLGLPRALAQTSTWRT